MLTGFGVAWAMFILILILGIGDGFQSGVNSMFQGYAKRSVWVTGFWTKHATYNGLPQDRRVKFSSNTLSLLQNKFREIDDISPEIPIEGNYLVSHKDESVKYEVKGINRSYLRIKSMQIKNGREFNVRDFIMNRRVVIIGEQVSKTLFYDEEAIGKNIIVSGVFFKVIGIIDDDGPFSQFENENIYAPSSVVTSIFNTEGEFYRFVLTLKKSANLNSQFDKKLKNFLAEEIGFSKNDNQALFIYNVDKQVENFNSLFKGIRIALWVIGICILITGIVGISNIMLIAVKERSQEIGIRKAIGASPKSIAILIITESTIITGIFGLIGMSIGVLGLSLYNQIIDTISNNSESFLHRGSVDIVIIVYSFIIVIVSGVLSGFFPARKASLITPIETIQNYN